MDCLKTSWDNAQGNERVKGRNLDYNNQEAAVRG